MTKVVPPTYGGSSFSCPHCSALAHQDWYYSVNALEHAQPNGPSNQRNNYVHLADFAVSSCFSCKEFTFWLRRTVLYPTTSSVPLPAENMPHDVAEVYCEAATIANLSPKAAAALLRLALQKLCVALGLPGKDLHKDIGRLVQQGLPVEVQQALDVVRVIGNNAVHPGEIQLDDNPAIANVMFPLINLIVERMISQPKQIAELYASLPAGAKDAIDRRDNKQ